MSKVWLTYIPTTNEGPEPQRLAPPYDFMVYPNKPFECAAEVAEDLTKAKPQFQITDSDGRPLPPPKKEASVDPSPQSPQATSPDPIPSTPDKKKGKNK